MNKCITMLIACAMLTRLVSAADSPSSPTEAAKAPVDITQYDHVIRVACVGDSITAGAGSSKGKSTSWDGVLGRMLDKKWKVDNFGSSGRTLLKHGDIPYQTKGAMKQALADKPDIVIVMLGTNDTKPQNWKLKDQFIADYKDLIDQFKALPTKPRIFVCTPPFVPGKGNYGINEAGVVEQLPMIQQIATDETASLIDVHAATVDSKDFPDNVHPNDKGAVVLAKTVYKELTGKDYAGNPPPPPPATKPTSPRQ
jgi:acyl-CoA thioesterase I